MLAKNKIIVKLDENGNETKRYRSAREIGEELGLSADSVYKKIKQGKLINDVKYEYRTIN